MYFKKADYNHLPDQKKVHFWPSEHFFDDIKKLIHIHSRMVMVIVAVVVVIVAVVVVMSSMISISRTICHSVFY